MANRPNKKQQNNLPPLAPKYQQANIFEERENVEFLYNTTNLFLRSTLYSSSSLTAPYPYIISQPSQHGQQLRQPQPPQQLQLPQPPQPLQPLQPLEIQNQTKLKVRINLLFFF